MGDEHWKWHGHAAPRWLAVTIRHTEHRVDPTGFRYAGRSKALLALTDCGIEFMVGGGPLDRTVHEPIRDHCDTCYGERRG